MEKLPHCIALYGKTRQTLPLGALDGGQPGFVSSLRAAMAARVLLDVVQRVVGHPRVPRGQQRLEGGCVYPQGQGAEFLGPA